MGHRHIALSGAAILPLAGMGLTAWFDVAHGAPMDMGMAELVATSIGVAVTAGLGWRILRSRPGHTVGRILLVMSYVGVLTSFFEVYAFNGFVNPGRGLPLQTAADVASSASWVTAYAALTALAFFFPDGRLPSPAWRPFVYASTVAFTGAWLAVTLQPGRQDEPFQHMLNPVGQAWLAGPGQAIVAVFMVGMLVTMAVAAGAVAERYSASSGVERLQLKWLAFSVGLVPVALGTCYLGGWLFHSDAAASVALQSALVLVPASVGVAVLRYRLYDIDRIMNRTAVYFCVTVALGAVYITASLVVGVVAGGGSALSAAIATLLTVVAFRPVRATLQDAVDRQFSRANYEGRRVVSAFVDDLRHGQSDPGEVEAVLARALDCPTLRVWLWVPSTGTYVSTGGTEIGLDRAAVDAMTRVDLGGAHHALVVLPPDGVVEADRASSVLGEARLALQVAALRAEVIVQSSVAAEARVRLVEATFEERRRLERDLHDGAQQRLVYLGITLRRLQKSLPAQARILEPALDQAVQQVSAALADLRSIARGAVPSRLSKGLGAALQDLAATAPLPVHLDLSAEPAPASVEAVAYFIACEAVTNAVKHASANALTVATLREPTGLRLRVSDDGIGGAEFAAGRGLAGLRSRVEANGGVIDLLSPPGAGTVLEVTLPCE